jgi:hypothetical protein
MRLLAARYCLGVPLLTAPSRAGFDPEKVTPMSMLDTATPEQVKAVLKKVFTPMKPPAKPLSVAERVRKLRRYLRYELRRGLTYDQLCQGLASPEIGITISKQALRKIMNEPPKTSGGALAVQARIDAEDAKAKS